MTGPLLSLSSQRSSAFGLSRDSLRWLGLVALFTLLLWLTGLASLFVVARSMHVDVPPHLASKLSLLKHDPEAIFAGDSRMLFQLDAELAARLMGKPPGAAINIAFEAGDPISLAAAMKAEPAAFKPATLVVSVSPFLLNEGVPLAILYPLGVVARLNVVEAFATFLPWRPGTLVRFIRETYEAAQNDAGEKRPVPARFGSQLFERNVLEKHLAKRLSGLSHYESWNLGGPKARFILQALCEAAPLAKRLVVVLPPWSPRYDIASDPDWQRMNGEFAMLIRDTGRRCGFETLAVDTVPGLDASAFADEMHLGPKGVPVYTRLLLERIGLLRAQL